MPDVTDVPTLDALLALRARTHAGTVFLRFAEGDRTFAETDAAVTRLARGLAAIGVTPGTYVPVVLANTDEFVLTWFALARLGAVATLVNTSFRGPALAHALEVTGSHLAVVDEEFAPFVDAVRTEVPALRQIVRRHELGGLDGPPVRPSAHRVTDPAMVLFTSGTTGRSKGCVLAHRYAVRQAELMVQHLQLRADDVLYCPFPLFHLDASVLTVVPALVLGTTAAIAGRFSASGFWDDVRRTGATVFDFMGATLTMLHKQPARPDDARNPARLGWGVPVPEFAPKFEARFGVQLVELYGSTDAGLPIYQPLHERRVGSCGRAIDAYDVDVRDADDRSVATGQVGELVVRPREPSIISDGYLGSPEATAESRRGGWFHTGDLVRRDADGWFFFVGRATDSIRRRGENISAFEVEEVVKLHPAVLDAAAYGVPSELTEDDVMVAVVARPGHQLDPADLTAFCAQRLARHMVPRYVDVVDDLPRTPTEKVEKAALRARGVCATTWDRERHPS